MGLKEEVGIELGGPQRIRKACEEIRGKEKAYSLPLGFYCILNFFIMKFCGQMYVKSKGKII